MKEPPGCELPPLFGWQWNQLEDFPDEERNVLATITCMQPRTLEPTQIGSGFVIQSRGNRGLILTAAHVITEGVQVFQNRDTRRRAHPTTPRDFLPPKELSAATSALRVIIQNGNRVEFCRVGYVVWDEAADLAILAVVPQNESVSDLFEWHMRLGATDPVVGDLVATMGFAEFRTESDAGDPWKGAITRRPIFRVGKVTCLHPEGAGLIRSPCLETTMPTFSGMSGGPAFLLPSGGSEPLVCGLLSHSGAMSSNPLEHHPDAWDRSKGTQPSTIALLPRRISGPCPDGSQVVKFKFTVSGKAVNEEIDTQIFAGDSAWIQDS